jgi:uncharacterized protein YbaR (Trm112 family)
MRLIVSWYGDDPKCPHCNHRLQVEGNDQPYFEFNVECPVCYKKVVVNQEIKAHLSKQEN